MYTILRLSKVTRPAHLGLTMTLLIAGVLVMGAGTVVVLAVGDQGLGLILALVGMAAFLGGAGLTLRSRR